MSGNWKKGAVSEPSRLPVSPAGVVPEVGESRSLQSGNPMAERNDRWLVPWVCIFLAAIIWLVFGQTLGHEFVNDDDPDYVYENPEVTQGLTLDGIVWAFTQVHSANWHPLTWISHMLDCQLYGLNPGGHHLTNVLLHTAATILLFLVLRRMTGLLWRSAFVSAVFAIHPLRVESVAWVAERKDVLSAFFFMLTLLAYVRYAEQFKVQLLGSANKSLKSFYGLTLLFFALGLMSKPMLVTLPLVLLLLDYWPLGRMTRFGASVPQLPGATKHGENGSTTLSTLAIARRRINPLLSEKLPFFKLTVLSCVITVFAQAEGIQSFEKVSLPLRMGNAAISYVVYLGQMFWPSGLAVLYPFPVRGVGVVGVVLSLILLAGISAGALILRRTRPYLLTGWLWYLIMLMPVIGFLQVGPQARANRYTYLPQIGLYLMLTWGVAELCAGWRHRRLILGGLSTVILAALIVCARTQTSYWRDSESLWTHTLACTSDNFMGHSNFGSALFQKGRMDEAIVQYQKALQIKPDCASVCYNLANTFLQKGQVDEAIAQYQRALQIEPGYAVAFNNLDYVLHLKERAEEALTQYQRALQSKPDSVEVLNNLAWLLATCPDAHLRNGAEAVHYSERACELTHYGVTLLVGTLAAAYAEAGRFDDAIAAAQKACTLATAAGEQDILEKNRKLLVLYRAHQPYHEAVEQFIPGVP